MIRSLIFTSLFAALIPAMGSAQQPAHEVVSPAVFKQRMSEAPGTLVDVRTPDEWNEGVIEGARLLDFHAEGFAEAIKKTDASKPVYLYCAVGGRSFKAAQLLEKAGFTHVVELDGGMGAWQEAGYPIVPPGKASNR